MKVILRKNFDQLGKIGDLIDVKDGYARNFLLPRQIAYIATKGNIRALEEEKQQLAKKEVKELEAAKILAAELENVSITIPVKVGEEDKIFGSVTSQMIANALKEKNYNIDKRNIDLEEPIKALGIYSVNVKLHSEINAVVKTWVVRE
ncbi:MAG: 50S ribosomal protein L9 [Ignavibacteriae bacterium]|nr:50S ribosomal protein L9 [Ignavibacteriota bacterium]MCB9210106.1 50S ribosomal protein L9 [Ignavibacteriales bacterium]MCB9218509.1 50S ribosomal protein L9 [Ignavibacteriales bacterium]MCB9259485.1 50S ribosomal protein L9 [Ignavibacteriales bacterium]